MIKKMEENTTFNFDLERMKRLVDEKDDCRVPTLKEMCEQANLNYDEISQDKKLQNDLFINFLKSL